MAVEFEKKMDELRKRYDQKVALRKAQMIQNQEQREERFFVVRNDIAFKGKTPCSEEEIKKIIEEEFQQTWSEAKYVLESGNVYCIRNDTNNVLVIWERSACSKSVGKMLMAHELIDEFEARILYGIKPKRS